MSRRQMRIPPIIMAKFQRDMIPYHICHTGNTSIPDDLEYPSPPRGYARILCPNPGCMRPLFVPERVPWVEFEKIKPGCHPFGKNPPNRFIGGLSSNFDPCWHRRCHNCGRWHHTTDICDQVNVQRKCGLCHKFKHDITECPWINNPTTRPDEPGCTNPGNRSATFFNINMRFGQRSIDSQISEAHPHFQTGTRR